MKKLTLLYLFIIPTLAYGWVIKESKQDEDVKIIVNDGGVFKEALTVVGATGATRSTHVNGFTSNSIYTGNPAANGNGIYRFNQFVSAGGSAATGDLAIVGSATSQAAVFYIRSACGGSTSAAAYHGVARHDGTTGTITTNMTSLTGDAITQSIAWSGNTLQFTLTSTFRACAIEVLGMGRGNDIRIDYP